MSEKYEQEHNPKAGGHRPQEEERGLISQGLSHKVQLFSAGRYGHKDTGMLLELVPEQGCQCNAG